jgi:hypothetical protein
MRNDLRAARTNWDDPVLRPSRQVDGVTSSINVDCCSYPIGVTQTSSRALSETLSSGVILVPGLPLAKNREAAWPEVR